MTICVIISLRYVKPQLASYALAMQCILLSSLYAVIVSRSAIILNDLCCPCIALELKHFLYGPAIKGGRNSMFYQAKCTLIFSAHI